MASAAREIPMLHHWTDATTRREEQSVVGHLISVVTVLPDNSRLSAPTHCWLYCWGYQDTTEASLTQ